MINQIMTHHKQQCLSDAKFYENIANLCLLLKESFPNLSLKLMNHYVRIGKNMLKKIFAKDKYCQKLLKKN